VSWLRLGLRGARGARLSVRSSVRSSRTAARALLALLGGGLVVAGAGCEIQEITVAEPETVAIAEVYFRVSDGIPDGFALLHQTTGGGGIPLQGTRIVVTAPATGFSVEMEDEPILSRCLAGLPPVGFQGRCYRLAEDDRGIVQADERLDVRIELGAGGVLHGSVRLPGDFVLLTPANPLPTQECRLPPGTQLPIRWTPARGAWAYLPEATVFGIEVALLPAGIRVPTDPLTLQGISISEEDTAIVFPAQFGIFNRFSSDRQVLVALQQGFPSASPVAGQVWISALERNAVNWSRGGNFNPSGTVRIPSVFGDGTGVIGGVVNRSFTFTTRPGLEFPPCGS
jgi:hypothetical protein